MFNMIKKIKDYNKINKMFDNFEKKEFNCHKDKIDLEDLFFYDIFVDVFSQRIIKNKISMNNTISIMESFLGSDNELRSNILKRVLEKVYENDNFVNSYCTSMFCVSRVSNLSESTFNRLIPIFIKIIDSYVNKLSIDVLGLVIYNIDNDVILENDYINQLIDLMNKKIDNINDIFDNTNNVDEYNILNYYCEIITLSKFIYNDETIELLKQINMEKVPHSIKLKVVESMIMKSVSISSDVIEKMFEDTRKGLETLQLLEHLNAKYLVPKNVKLTQEDIALLVMEDCLIEDSNYSCKPFELKIIDYLDKDKYRYYIFSFKDLNAEDREKNMIAISWGYEINELRSFGIFNNYTKFEKIENDYIEQAKKLLDESKRL